MLVEGDITDGRVTGESVRATREALFDYCRFDTLTIVEKLRSLLGQQPSVWRTGESKPHKMERLQPKRALLRCLTDFRLDHAGDDRPSSCQ